jgi:predicted nucleotidyltransferase
MEKIGMDVGYTSKIREYFKDKPVLKAYLFGSFARGEANQGSDIDILVELDYSKPIGLEFVQMQLDLQDLLNRKVDLISEKAVSKYIKPYIDKDKVMIYAR